MDGWPVWLASVSVRSGRRPAGPPLPTARWSPDQYARGDELLGRLLTGLGDPTRARQFRMNGLLCRHLALNAAEKAAVERVPGWLTAPPSHLAGAPVEILWETEPGSLSTRPCEAPTRLVDPATGHRMAGECGACPTCAARRHQEGG